MLICYFLVTLPCVWVVLFEIVVRGLAFDFFVRDVCFVRPQFSALFRSCVCIVCVDLLFFVLACLLSLLLCGFVLCCVVVVCV